MGTRGPHFEAEAIYGARMPAQSGELQRRDDARMAELNQLIREGKGNVEPRLSRLDAGEMDSIRHALRDGMSPRAVKRKFRVPLRTVMDIASGQLSLLAGT